MEAEKLQRLHDSLAKLAPKGRSGGLGMGGLGKERGAGAKDTSLPQNPLYANFVRAGYFKKRKFDDDGDAIDKEELVVEKKDKKEKESKESKKKAKKTGSTKTTKVVIDAALLPFIEFIITALKASTDHKSSKKSLQKSVLKSIQGLDKGEAKEFFKGLVNLLVDRQECKIDEEGDITYTEPPVVESESESESSDSDSSSSDSSSDSDSDSDSSSNSSSGSSSSDSDSDSDLEEEEEEDEDLLKWRQALLSAITTEKGGISHKKLSKAFSKQMDGIDKAEKKEMIAGLVNVLIDKSLVTLEGDTIVAA